MKIKNIKFKAKQLNSGKWFEGDLVRLGNRVCIGGDHIKDGITDVDPSTVYQFTGLKDCEGNEIWEGDLLQSEESERIYEVVWDEYGGFVVKDTVAGVCLPIFLGSALRTIEFKVIGDKYSIKKNSI